MNEEEINQCAKAAFAANPDAQQLHVIATGDCFRNEHDARYAAHQLPEDRRWVRVVERDAKKTPPKMAAKTAPSGPTGDGEGAAGSDAGLGGGAGGTHVGGVAGAATEAKPPAKAEPKATAKEEPKAKAAKKGK